MDDSSYGDVEEERRGSDDEEEDEATEVKNLQRFQSRQWPQSYKCVFVSLVTSLMFTSGVFGFMEVSESEEVGDVISHFRCPSKNRKKKIEKPFFLFSFLFYTIISSLSGCYS